MRLYKVKYSGENTEFWMFVLGENLEDAEQEFLKAYEKVGFGEIGPDDYEIEEVYVENLYPTKHGGYLTLPDELKG